MTQQGPNINPQALFICQNRHADILSPGHENLWKIKEKTLTGRGVKHRKGKKTQPVVPPKRSSPIGNAPPYGPKTRQRVGGKAKDVRPNACRCPVYFLGDGGKVPGRVLPGEPWCGKSRRNGKGPLCRDGPPKKKCDKPSLAPCRGRARGWSR